MTSPTPPNRTVRFSLRLAPEEMHKVDELQERQGGERVISANTVIAQCVNDAYGARVVTGEGTVPLPVSPRAMDAIRWTADTLGMSLPDALTALVIRGLPHTPSESCNHRAPGKPAPMPPQALKAVPAPPVAPAPQLPAPPAPKGRPRPSWTQRAGSTPKPPAPAPAPPLYATPKPSGLPPAPTVAGQQPFDPDTTQETRNDH